MSLNILRRAFNAEFVQSVICQRSLYLYNNGKVKSCAPIVPFSLIRVRGEFRNSQSTIFIPTRSIYTTMTNKPRNALLQQTTNVSKTCIKTLSTTIEVETKTSPESHPRTSANVSCLRTMASIQKLVVEPTREHIENIRHVLRNMQAKDNDEQEMTMSKDLESGIATICIRSAAKNGISGKMMCDFLDIVEELHNWEEGKGVILYGHRGFFCSG